MNNLNKRLIFLCCIVPLLGGCVAAAIVGGVTAGAYVFHDRRTPETYLQDKTIELSAFKAFELSDQLNDHADISVTSFNRVVLMTGTVPDVKTRRQAESIISQMENVKSVFNELSVLQLGQKQVSTVNDTLLASQINAEFLAREQLDPTRVKVISENGTVYLMGLVYKHEANKAIETARNTNGVKRVIQLFEIIG